MPKERNFNPVQAQRKADKAKAIKKGKADVAATRNERLAKKNPDRIQKQIDDLKAITEGGGKLTTHEEQVLGGLEKELKAVSKAREALGDRAPTFHRRELTHRGQDNKDSLGRKRRRETGDNGDNNSSADDDIPDEIRRIPMPRDTPPPIPKRYLDEWYAKRRAMRNTNSNTEPLGTGRSNGGRGERETDVSAPELMSRPTSSNASAQPVEAKTIYEAKPVVRDLQKEAVSAFMPTVVRRKLEKSRGIGGLLEPEEVDRLEQEGYIKTFSPAPDGKMDNGNRHEFKDEDGTKTSQLRALHLPKAAGVSQPTTYQATVEDVDDEEG